MLKIIKIKQPKSQSMKCFIILLLSVTLFSSCDSHAQSNNGPTPEQINDRFFQLLKKEGTDKALDYAISSNQWVKPEDMEAIKERLRSVTPQLGAYRGHSLITRKSVGEGLVLYSFIVKYDRQPIRFLITYYRPEARWQLQNFEYDDNMLVELKEAAGIYRLEENLPKVQ